MSAEREGAYYNFQRLAAQLHAEASRVERGGTCIESSLLRQVANFIRDSHVQDVPEGWNSATRPIIGENQVLFSDIPEGGYRPRAWESS